MLTALYKRATMHIYMQHFQQKVNFSLEELGSFAELIGVGKLGNRHLQSVKDIGQMFLFENYMCF